MSSRYERLPGKGRRLLGLDYLLLADDHLLLARRQGYTENYQRFFFTDIQALTLRETRRREVTAAVLGALALLMMWMFWASELVPLKVFWGVLLGVVLLLSLLNWWAGPTASCHLTTALQSVELTSLRRRRRARPIIARLAAKITQAQGSYEPAEVAGPEAALSTVQMAPSPVRHRAAPPPLPTAYKGLWHWLLFGFLLVDSALTFWQIRSDSLVADMVAGVFFLAELVVAITAVLRQRVLIVARPIRLLASSALGFLLLLLVAGWVVGTVTGFTMAFEAAASNQPQLDPFAAQRQAEPLSWVSLVGTTALGLAGLGVMSRSSRGRARVGG